MLIAHLPAGYILGRTTRTKGAMLGGVLLASVLPDFDMLWFYLVDGGSVLHHRYWTHVPGFWLIVAAITLPAVSMLKRSWLPVATLGFSAILLHLVLDTLVGSIMWQWPFSRDFFQLATVPATRSHWILSFMFHWSFLVELLICAVAIILYLRTRNE